jgi:hypothetical protein
MKRYSFIIIVLMSGFSSYCQIDEQTHIIRKGNVVYDFTFAELAVKCLETEDSAYLRKIADLKATDHIFNHSKQFNYDVPNNSKIELIKYLLEPINEKKKILREFIRNLQFAKDSIASTDFAQKVCIQYLPDNFQYSSSLFFTFGYDIGVVYGGNASINIAHPYFLKTPNEIKYYSVHELHHAGFVILKNNFMPSLDILNYRQMAELIEYFTHLEGMGTFAPLDIRIKENAMNIDKDYLALRDSVLMKEYEKEFFEIYFYFKNNPDSLITIKDWEMISILSDEKRLWYRIGAHIAQTIDMNLGREKLVSLISLPSENFINTYLLIKDKYTLSGIQHKNNIKPVSVWFTPDQ